MKVLVTGADNLTGGQLVGMLVQGGFTVRVLLRPGSEPAALEDLALDRVPGTVLDQESALEAVSGCHAVFHCDTVTALRPPRARWIATHNLEGTRNVLVAMTRAGVEELVWMGSASSFGYGDAEHPGTEQSPYRGDRFGLASFDSLHAAQELVLRYAREGRVRGMVLNPTLVMGGPDRATSPWQALVRCAAGGPGWYPSGGVNVVGAADAAAAALKALGRGEAGRCYILGGENVSYRELMERLAEALGVGAPLQAAADRRVARRGTAGSLMLKLGRTPSLTAPEARIATTVMYYDPSRAVAELQMQRTPFDALIEQCCRVQGADRR